MRVPGDSEIIKHLRQKKAPRKNRGAIVYLVFYLSVFTTDY